MDTKMHPSTYFSGSSAFKYEKTLRLETGYGSSYYHSIMAMKSYENLSIEEIRMEDYHASCGLFGSTFSKLGAALCADPEQKLKPYNYGQIFMDAITIKHEDKKIELLPPPAPDVPVNDVKMTNPIPKQNSISLCFHGKQNVQVFIKSVGESSLNLSFQDNSSARNVDHESSESFKSKARSCDPTVEPTFPKHDLREKKSKEKVHKDESVTKEESSRKRRRH